MARRILVATLSAAGGIIAPAHGGVITFYDVFKTQQREQIDEINLSAPPEWYFSARVFTDEAFTISGAEVTYAGPESPIVLGTTDDTVFTASFSYTSHFDLDTAFPSTTYTFTIQGGVHDTETASLDLGVDMYPSPQPKLLNGSWTALQSVDAASGFTGEIAAWTPQAEAEFGLTYAFVTDAATSEILQLTISDPSETVVSIPGGLLEPDHAYRLDLVYSARIDEQNVLLDGAYGVVGFDTRVYVSFTTLPAPSCAGDINGDGSTNTGDFNILAGNFGGGPGATQAQGDLSGDGFVNTADFNILAGDFGCTVN